MGMKNCGKGFTLIELVVVIVCIGILAMISLPRFIDISGETETSSEDDMVGLIRTGIQLSRAQNMVDNGGNGTYPQELDGAQPGQSSSNNPFFENILQNPYRGNQWIKNGDTQYTGPGGGVYSYNPNTGTFTKQN